MSALPRVAALLDSYAGTGVSSPSLARQAPRDQRLIRRFSTKVAAGAPTPTDDHLDDDCDLTELLVRNPESTFIYTVAGDSMDLAGIFDGDYVIVDRSLSPGLGDIVLAILEGARHTIKRLAMQNGMPKLVPVSSNPAYKPVVPDEGNELQLWGVVTAVVRRMRQ